MSKPSVVYVIFAVLLIGGIWAILLAGSKLQAPPHVEGVWMIQWDDSSEPQRMQVEQSGMFVSARVERTALHGKLVSRPDEPGFDVRLINKRGQGLHVGPIPHRVLGKVPVTSATQPTRRGYAVRQPPASQPSHAH